MLTRTEVKVKKMKTIKNHYDKTSNANKTIVKPHNYFQGEFHSIIIFERRILHKSVLSLYPDSHNMVR